MLQCVTFALPHDKLGEEVAAAIVLREGISAEEKEIRGFASERLAPFKVPAKIVILPEIPAAPPASSSGSAWPRSSASPDFCVTRGARKKQL